MKHLKLFLLFFVCSLACLNAQSQNDGFKASDNQVSISDIESNPSKEWQRILLISIPATLIVLLGFVIYMTHEVSKLNRRLTSLRSLNSPTTTKEQTSEEEAKVIEKLLQPSIRTLSDKVDLLASATAKVKTLKELSEKNNSSPEEDGLSRQLEELTTSLDNQLKSIREQISRSYESISHEISATKSNHSSDGSEAPVSTNGTTVDNLKTGDGKNLIEPLWPDAFALNAPLHSSRVLIEKGIFQSNSAAVALFVGLVDLDWNLKHGTLGRSDFAKKLHGLSRSLHEWFYQFPKNSEPAPDSLVQWCETYQGIISEKYPSLHIRSTYPGVPFDPDKMVRDDERSGNTSYIKLSLSWVIVDVIDDQTRTLQRSTVITE